MADGNTRRTHHRAGVMAGGTPTSSRGGKTERKTLAKPSAGGVRVVLELNQREQTVGAGLLGLTVCLTARRLTALAGDDQRRRWCAARLY